MSLLKHTDDTDVVFDALMTIYNKKVMDLPIRRVSITVSKLRFFNGYEQLDMFVDYKEQEEKRRLQRTLDCIQQRYGKDAVLRTSALLEDSTIKERHSYIGGHRR